MPKPLYVRELSYEELFRLRRYVRGDDIFALRRAQILMGSGQGLGVQELSEQVGLTPQMVRCVIHEYQKKGWAIFQRGSHRPKSSAPLLDEVMCQKLGRLLHQSPRTFGAHSSLWSCSLLAQVAFEQGITPHQVSASTIERAIQRLGVSWKRAKAWITSPDPCYVIKKNGAPD